MNKDEKNIGKCRHNYQPVCVKKQTVDRKYETYDRVLHDSKVIENETLVLFCINCGDKIT